jgi:bifunctional DNase/RNase
MDAEDIKLADAARHELRAILKWQEGRNVLPIVAAMGCVMAAAAIAGYSAGNERQRRTTIEVLTDVLQRYAHECHELHVASAMEDATLSMTQ